MEEGVPQARRAVVESGADPRITRALYLFRRQGLNPIPAPAQAYTWTRLEGDRRRVTLRSFFPSVESYEKVDRAMHEYVGLLCARLTPPHA